MYKRQGKGNGDAIVSSMRRDGVIVRPVSYKRGSQSAAGKRNRVAAITPVIENGSVYVPDAMLASWSRSFVAECEGFGVLRADDQVDCLTMALLYLAPRVGMDVSDMLVDIDRRHARARPKTGRSRGIYRS